METKRTRSFWHWGYADEPIPEETLNHAKSLAMLALGMDDLPRITPPVLEDLNLRAPRFDLPDALRDLCSDTPYDRASHHYGKSYRDVIRGLYGQFDNPPDYVAFPRSDDHIQQLMAFCAAEGIALIPFGGGSSVVGGVEPPQGYGGVIYLQYAAL